MSIANRMMPFLKRHVIIIALLVAYAFVNLYFLYTHPGSIYNDPEYFGEEISTYGSRDAALYAKMAWQLLNDGIYGYEYSPNAAGQSNAYVTYGQPFYLAAIFKTAEVLNTNHLMLYRLANMMLNLGIVILIYSIAQRLFRNRWISVIASILYMTHIAPLHYFRAALTEIPSIFLLMLSIWIYIIALKKKDFKWHMFFGIVASLMLMFRATPAPMLLFAWFLTVSRYGWKDGIKTGFIWCIGPLITMAPWAARNIYHFGHAYLFSNHAGGPLLGGANPFYRVPPEDLVHEAVAKGYNQEQYAKILIPQGFKEDFALWFSWFTMGKTFWLFFDNNFTPDGLGPYNRYISGTLRSFFVVQNLFLAGVGLMSAILTRKHRPVMYLSVLVLIYIAASNIFLALPRYGLLIMPLLAIIGAYGIVTLVGFVVGKVKALRMKNAMQ
ncbi:Dolichyl-phosphate-mannose-protein mannosyltransferase [Bhargavaea cecembensis DSE10]|uniref:Dolichyl-phosphate-mannose-protein mannosyltransferase n=1 Tax=Bhargavaea cecembensis DSE10 TaxID=1235279 RepID=M7NHG2_9BACL|nr:glycosyltransferase family 39 protein [Bhargavaea cecembensis]EMR06626.1 Dolichyl-phosphate-mannose-protein mannosyltransferase [Bhargavaea cecembensis DSE10]